LDAVLDDEDDDCDEGEDNASEYEGESGEEDGTQLDTNEVAGVKRVATDESLDTSPRKKQRSV
jgi:hypothetical protein